jgi:predicted DCC family thiol-disulfide oxidoreductase YuxK
MKAVGAMQAGQQIVIDPKAPGGVNSPSGLILFDGVCILCSRGCGFVSKRDRRHYFRFIAMQSPEGRSIAKQLDIDPDRPDTFAFVASGQAFVKSEAALRIARELPFWNRTYALHFIPTTMRDAIYDWIARNRYRWFGRREACLLTNPDGSWPS